MNKSIRPLHLILGGIAAHVVGRLIPGIAGDAIVTIGSIALLIGIINGIVGLVKNRKKL